MKSLIMALIIAAVIVAGGLYCTNQVEELMMELTKKSDSIAENINNDGYDSAKDILLEIEKSLETDAAILASYLDHNELDKIEVAVAQLEVYLERQEKTPALAGTNTLKRYFQRIPKDYKIKLENIF